MSLYFSFFFFLMNCTWVQTPRFVINMIIKYNFYPTCDYLRKKIFREKDLVKLFKINHKKEM